MGTTVRLLLDGPEQLLDLGEERVHRAEARWSRFEPSSELCQLNAGAGRPTVVSVETFALVESALAAWRQTDGLFDPSVITVLEALGYDRTFQAVDLADVDDALVRDDLAVPGPAGIKLHPTALMIELPCGLRLDLGGIAKGATADLVVAELRNAGAAAVCLSIGGDLRASGPGPEEGEWEVAFADQEHGQRLRLSSGAVCTSSVSRRRWVRNGITQHHLIDPKTSRPMESDVTTSTVIAGTALAAEVLAKLPIGWGSVKGSEFIRNMNATGRLVLADGLTVEIAGIEKFLAPAVAA